MQPATEEQKKKLKGKRADYILYQSGTTNPLIVIEAKRPTEDIYQALEQGVNYAKSIEAPLVIATNGEFTKCYHVNFKKTLIRNGEEVKEFFTEKETLKFVEQPRLRKGEERFSEFANILFLKIIGEIEEEKEKSTSRMDKALEHFRQKYQEGELFSVSKIEDTKTLEEIVFRLNPLSLVETERDVKGEAFEYFLQRYNAGEKDLGEYFTPRHVIRNLVAILQPRFKDKAYDPFCGTGGMLIECFKYVSERVKLDSESLKILRNSFYGNEITNVARITKMNMILFGDGHNNIQKRDTFQHPVDNEYELVITNIPFGFEDIDYGHLYPINCNYGDCLAIQHCLKACKLNGREVVIEEKTNSPLFTKIYYRDIENDKYNLLAVPPNFSLLKKANKEYFLLSEIANIKRGCFELKREEFASSGYAKVYQPNHAISGDFSSGDRYIMEERYQQLKGYELQIDDIIMSVSGT
ncbi:9079_t:CDS:2 [Ambispora gerdemannii]|uniref:site-specific DNA-methyltransferase (adenine-specific) n=1 Tax=Ambispora gerdemannii TaxID=144530 RepID=A0A9N8VBG7_9GLOM|nr:9079_t:CDS:2 [Ambispora gerdemannii]